MKINDRVITPLGCGVVVGFDLPDSDVKRIVVKLDKNIYNYDKNEYCFFYEEIQQEP